MAFYPSAHTGVGPPGDSVPVGAPAPRRFYSTPPSNTHDVSPPAPSFTHPHTTHSPGSEGGGLPQRDRDGMFAPRSFQTPGFALASGPPPSTAPLPSSLPLPFFPSSSTSTASSTSNPPLQQSSSSGVAAATATAAVVGPRSYYTSASAVPGSTDMRPSIVEVTPSNGGKNRGKRRRGGRGGGRGGRGGRRSRKRGRGKRGKRGRDRGRGGRGKERTGAGGGGESVGVVGERIGVGVGVGPNPWMNRPNPMLMVPSEDQQQLQHPPQGPPASYYQYQAAHAQAQAQAAYEQQQQHGGPGVGGPPYGMGMGMGMGMMMVPPGRTLSAPPPGANFPVPGGHPFPPSRMHSQLPPSRQDQALALPRDFLRAYNAPAPFGQLQEIAGRAVEDLPTFDVDPSATSASSFVLATPPQFSKLVGSVDRNRGGPPSIGVRRQQSLTSTPYRRFSSMFLDPALQRLVSTPHQMRHQCNAPNPFERLTEFHTFYDMTGSDAERRLGVGGGGLFQENDLESPSSSSDGLGVIIQRFRKLGREHFKAIDSLDSSMVFLCCCSYAQQHSVVMSQVQAWVSLPSHANVCKLRKVFDDAERRATFVYDFEFGAQTLGYWWRRNQKDGPDVALLMWSILAHCIAGLRHIHECGLTYRLVHPSKILVIPSASTFRPEGNRVDEDGKRMYTTTSLRKRQKRFQCVLGSGGIVNSLWNLGDSRPEDIHQAQRTDMVLLGNMVANLFLDKFSSDAVSEEEMVRVRDLAGDDRLVGFITRLQEFGSSAPPPSSGDSSGFTCILPYDSLTRDLAPQISREVSYLSAYNSFLLTELEKEVENGRLFKLLLKIQFFVHQLDAALLREDDPRILCQLFFDFLFQASSGESGQGGGKLDWARVVECLNKLDAGVDEEILLKSRNEKIIIVASFAEIKDAFANAFSAFLKE